MNVLTQYIGDATIQLAIISIDPHFPHKSLVTYSIRLPYVAHSESATESGRTHVGSDLSVVTGADDTETLREAYRALCSFLSATAESYGHAMRNSGSYDFLEYLKTDTENGDLFPADIAEWAYLNSDELAIESMDMDDDLSWLQEGNERDCYDNRN